MKAIFLDIDGVLNSGQWFRKVRSTSWKWRQMAGKYLSYSVDKKAIKLLNEIIEATDAKIVLSSSWRLGPPLVTLKVQFKEIGIDLYDKTPCWGELGITDWESYKDESGQEHLRVIPRGDIIAKYLEEHPEFTSYVILDDVDQFNEEQHNHLVFTDREVGLTKDDVINAITILNTI